VEGRRPCHFWVVCLAAETLGVGLCGQRDCLLGGEGGSSALPGCPGPSEGGREEREARSEEVRIVRIEERGSRSEDRGAVEHTGRTVVDRLGSGQTDRQTRQTDRLQQHCAQAVVERARGEIGWSGLLVGPFRCAWLAGCGLLAISCRLGRRASSAPTTSPASGASQDLSQKWAPK
jgi:hypothetical protein